MRGSDVVRQRARETRKALSQTCFDLRGNHCGASREGRPIIVRIRGVIKFMVQPLTVPRGQMGKARLQPLPAAGDVLAGSGFATVHGGGDGLVRISLDQPQVGCRPLLATQSGNRLQDLPFRFFLFGLLRWIGPAATVHLCVGWLRRRCLEVLRS